MAELWRRQPSFRVASEDLVQSNNGQSALIASLFFEAEEGEAGEAIGSASHLVTFASASVGHAGVLGSGSQTFAMASTAAGLTSAIGQAAHTLPSPSTAAQAMSSIIGQALHIIMVASQAGGNSAQHSCGPKKGFLGTHGSMRAGF